MRKKISFDYDGTISNQARIQNLAKRLVNNPRYDVWIVTSRYEDGNTLDVYETAEEIGIDFENIIFTNGEFKVRTLVRESFDYHIDDSMTEIKEIRAKSYIKVFHINDKINIP